MEAILLEPGSQDDFDKIKEFALKNGIQTSILDKEEFRFIERKKLADIADAKYPQLDLSMEEIIAITKETRAEQYAKRNLGGN